MLAQRLMWWSNISPALGKRLVFAGVHGRNRWTDGRPEQTEVNQHAPTSVYRGGDIIITIIKT